MGICVEQCCPYLINGSFPLGNICSISSIAIQLLIVLPRITHENNENAKDFYGESDKHLTETSILQKHKTREYV